MDDTQKKLKARFKNVDGLERVFILPVIVLTSLFIGIGARVWNIFK